jgi:hypothetical protein
LVFASDPPISATLGATYIYTVEVAVDAGLQAQPTEEATEEATGEVTGEVTEEATEEDGQPIEETPRPQDEVSVLGSFTVTAPLLPDWLALEVAVDGATLLTGTPELDHAGEHTVTLELADDQGIVVTQTFTITVVEPVIEVAPLDLLSDEDTPLAGRIVATASTGALLTYTVEISPAHGVLTLTTALDASTGEPLRQVAQPQTDAAAATSTEAGEGDAEGEATGGEAVEPGAEGSEQPSGAPAEDATPAAETTGEESFGEVTSDMVTAPSGEEPTAGEFGVAAPGDFIYLPAPDFAGEDAFTLRIAAAGDVSVTLPLTITVLPVNDAPRLDFAPVITVTPGAEVSLPIIVVDPESSPVELRADALPSGLALVDGSVQGLVALDALGSYFVVFTADDGEGGVTTVPVEWVVVPAELPGEEPAPTEEAAPTEPPQEEGPGDDAAAEGTESPLPPPVESSPTEEPTDAATGAGVVELSAFDFVNATQGTGSLEGYAWLPPQSFGSCPVAPDALTPQPAGLEGRTLADEARATDPMGAPSLEYTVAFSAPGDYVVAVCGCAPQLTAEELAGGELAGGEFVSTAPNNGAVFVGLNGAPVVIDGAGQVLPLSGFGDWPGFTWQDRWRDPAGGSSGAVTISIAEEGAQTLQLWMADDGLIVYGLRVTPLAEANVEPGATPALCGPSIEAAP